MQKIFLLFVFLFQASFLFAQNQNRLLADEYFYKSDYEKAIFYYEKAWNESVIDRKSIIYNFVVSLETKNDIKSAEKYIKKLSKSEYQNPKFEAFVLSKYEKWTLTSKHEKELEKLIKNYQDKENLLNWLIEFQDLKDAEKIILVERSKTQNPILYSQQLSTVYKNQNNKTAYLNELLQLIQYEPSNENVEKVKNIYSALLKNEKELDELAQVLIKTINQNPDNQFYVELYAWVFIQKKEFNKAYIQYKALDMRKNLGGKKLDELANLCLKNSDFETANKIYQYLVNQYSQSEYKYGFLQAKDLQLKANYPVNDSLLSILINDYQNFIKTVSQPSLKNQLKIELVSLYAYYKKDFSAAENLLNELTNETKNNSEQNAKTKILLGDIKLLKGDNWQASILYSQAEKLVKDTPLAYEAKLKNAKVFYYNYEFLLAQEQLNILKKATTREISNDAIQMSTFIQDQLIADSSSPALIMFAQAELLAFKNELNLANNKYDSILLKFPQEEIRDDVYWKKGNLEEKLSHYDKAVSYYQIIVNNFSEDIYADDALNKLATIYLNVLNDTEKAKENYQNLFTKYPSSIYSEEARKQFRLLRGDKIE